MKIITIVLAAAAVAALLPAGTFADNGGLVVYVDALNMRAEPGTSADVVAELPRGTSLIASIDDGKTVDGCYWIPVKAGSKSGWVVAEYTVPEDAFDALAEADAAGRVGDAGRMMKEIRLACEGSEWGDYRLDVSPDGRKVVCAAFGPALYFEAGKGLAYNLGDTWSGGGTSEWSADSRYLGYYVLPEIRSAVILYDTAKAEVVAVVDVASSYAFVPGYMVWLGTEEVEPPAGGPDYDGRLPAVMAWDLAAAEELRLLAVDSSTGREGDGGYEVKVVEVGDAPPAVAESRIYKAYRGKYVAWEFEPYDE